MKTGFDSNMKLLMGGSFKGDNYWSKPASDIDKCFKIYYFINGEASVSSKNTITTLYPNNLYFINGYDLSSQLCQNYMSVYWLHFIPDSVYLNHLLKTNFFVVSLDITLFSSFTPLFCKLRDYFEGTLSVDENRVVILKIQSFVQFVIAQILEQCTSINFETNSNYIRLLPALEFIKVHHNTNISLAMLAEECCLSPNYFHRLFKKNFNITPFYYIIKMRMEEALRLLIYSELPVREIAYKLGYEDEAYFSRIFSKTYHVSPGRYRKSYKTRIP